MNLFFAGGEISSHRKVLKEMNASHIALSFVGLTRKIKNTTAWLLDSKFPEDTSLLVDSGAYTVNKGESKFTVRDLKDISERYQEFVLANLDRVDAVTEFDALALGRDWIEQQREEFYDRLPDEKFIPIWHPETGMENLLELADRYIRIGVPTTDLQGRNLAPVLNRLASDGNRIHGVAMTHVDLMYEIDWDSVSSTSWISPQQYGDTIVWTGRELKRYPKKSKDQARRRYRTLFEREGFDAEAIANDDSTEVLRLSIWSWNQLIADIEKKKNHLTREIVTTQPETREPTFMEVDGVEVDTQTGEVRKEVSTEVALVKRDPIPLPVLGMTTRTERQVDPETNEERTVEVQDLTIRSDSMRRCTTCFLASKCPAFDPNATCAFDIPIRITTRDQFARLQNSIIEMQAQRVMFMRFAEEQEGGYADPNLSVELDRLQKMLKTKNEMEQEGFSFKLEAKQTGGQQGQVGMLARLFGEQASQKVRELESGPVSVEEVHDVIEAQWSEG